MADVILPPKRIGRPPRPITAELLQEMIERHESGQTISRICREMQFRYYRVRDALNEAGVEIRKNAWGAAHPRWKGGRTVEKRTGYIRITLPRDDPYRGMGDCHGALWEHRYVMAQFLGRPLESFESVHHLDGNKSNNCLTNLQLRIGGHGIGSVFKCQDCGSSNVKAEELTNGGD